MLSKESTCQICTQPAFPKVIGGNSAGTLITSLDFHSSTTQLAVGGFTYDGPLTSWYAGGTPANAPILLNY